MPKSSIYLDHAAATPLEPRVLAAMQPYLTYDFYNPSATYLPAKAVRRALENARGKIAQWLGARPSEIIFTAGGTEANNLAIHGIMRRYPAATVVVSAIEHESVLAPAHRNRHREAAVEPDGRISLETLRQAIDDETVLVSIGYVNNEIGTIQPLKDVARLVASIRRERQRVDNGLPLYFHTDAAQAGNYLDLHVSRLGVDLLSLNGGKIYGPKQSGVLYVKAGLEIEPLITGGGQERGLRSGTENVAAAIGLATALDIAQTMRHDESNRLQQLQADCITQLTKLEGVTLNGSRKQRVVNNIHITIENTDNERLLLELESGGILAAAGSACSASSQEPSHVLRALGLSDADARASLRFSLGRETDAAAISKLVAALRKQLA